MKKQLLFLLTAILSLNSYAQISFEKGYYIDNQNQRINCFIKNLDWESNPTEFEFKLSENTDPKIASIRSAQEFGVGNYLKYIRYTVKIDRSSEDLNNLSKDRNPRFKEEELYLKVLVEGKATLYAYVDRKLNRYFYNKENSGIDQLIFKSYFTQDNKVGTNYGFRQQLMVDLECSNLGVNKVDKLKYHKKVLVSFFVDYNKCNEQEYINFEDIQEKDLFNLNIRPGLNSSSVLLDIENNPDVAFDTELGFRFGIEAEFVMPFNKNKWAIIIEPTYQSYQTEKGLFKVDYKSIELPIGVRHYFFLNENSKIFINGSGIVEFTGNSVIEVTSIGDLGVERTSSLELNSVLNFAFGIGYKFNNMYSLELRYLTDRELFSVNNLNTAYKTVSVIFGYSLF